QRQAGYVGIDRVDPLDLCGGQVAPVRTPDCRSLAAEFCRIRVRSLGQVGAVEQPILVADEEIADAPVVAYRLVLDLGHARGQVDRGGGEAVQERSQAIDVPFQAGQVRAHHRQLRM